MSEKENNVFDAAMDYMQPYEGGYVCDPDDSGGDTFRGISRRVWPNWDGWDLIDQAKREGCRSAAAIDKCFAQDAVMAELVDGFYRQNFYDPIDQVKA